MDIKETEHNFARLTDLIAARKLRAALDLLSEITRKASFSDHYYQLESISENYRNLLKFEFEGYRDPERDQILNGLCASMLNLADEIRHTVSDPSKHYTRGEKSMIQKEFGLEPGRVATYFDSILFSLEMQKMSDETGVAFDPEESFDQVFRLLWLTDRLDEETSSGVRKMIHSDLVPWYDKSLVVSGLLLSLLRYFDPAKILLLIEFTRAHEPQVYERALIGLVLSLAVYGKRAGYSGEVNKAMKDIGRDIHIRNDVETILLQLLLAQETEKITEEFEKEVLPGMKKMLPRIEDKLQLGNLFEDEDEEGRNPGWKEIMDEVPGLFERMEKFTRMQMEGGDVFMGTFKMLKGFEFFRSMSNWFVPYYPEHPRIVAREESYREGYQRLLENMNHAFYICNSDKYSFVLNFMVLPDEQKEMILNHFEAELEQMKELTDEEKILGNDTGSRSVFTQYIQDLYRFFKLYPYRNEFDDFFAKKIRFPELWFYHHWFAGEKFAEKVAAFLFDNDHFEESIAVYELLLRDEAPASEYFERIGYSYQKMKRYELAIGYYRKAELFDCDRLWISGKLGFCYMKTGDWENARRYYSEAARLKPDDLNLQVHIGQCSLNLQEFEEALEQFGKVRYYQPGNIRVLRPVAYCHFILGRLEESSSLYEELLNSETPTPYDLMNAGHVQLCLGNRKEALVLYRRALSDQGFHPDLFSAAFEEDVAWLSKNGVNQEEIPLILDYLLFRT